MKIDLTDQEIEFLIDILEAHGMQASGIRGKLLEASPFADEDEEEA